MPQLNQLPGLWKALAEGDLDLSVGGGSQPEIRLTNTPHNAAWTQLTDAGFVSAVVTNHFASESLSIAAADNNLGGDGKMDIAIADTDFVSAGNPTGPFQYVYLVDVTSGLLLGYYDFGSAQTIPAGFALSIRSTDAADRLISISS